VRRNFIAVLLGLACIGLLAGCDSDDDASHIADPAKSDPAEVARLHAQVMTFCGGCHDPPRPDSFPRNAWRAEIELAYRLFAESHRRDLTPPPMSDVVNWYQTQAPTALRLEAAQESPSPVQFQHQEVRLDGHRPLAHHSSTPGVSHIHVPPPRADGTPLSVMFCDMSRNGLFTLSAPARHLTISETTSARQPAHVEQTDLDADGTPDYLLCELGSFLPEDHHRGRLVWLKVSSGKTPVTHVLLDSVGRVADARAGDFDEDGDLDVIVAVFGWRTTGQLLFLEQTGKSNGIPRFRTKQLDDRHGAIHIPVIDLDADGDLDFVALFSQEHETIEAFLNRGDATFERQIVYLTGSPSYGSSGIELADLDRDGDTDILYTNGDTLDSSLLKPYHSVQWLENTGDFPFPRHEIGALPGASRAVASDLDSDGDLDVIASAWIPPNAQPPAPRPDNTYTTLVWYEHTAPGTFECHPLKSAQRDGFLALSVTDLNQDGAPDIIAGDFSSATGTSAAWLEIHWNSGGQ